MKGTNDLFLLINSMSKSEKRFFKLSASIHSGEKNYLVLFNAIEKQKEYNEERIKRELKDRSFADNIAYEKNYLFKQVLKTLRNYHSGKSVDFQLTEMLEEISILHSRGLYKICEKTIVKAKKIAVDHERNAFLLELLKWEWDLMHSRFAIDEVEKNVKGILVQYETIMSKISNLNKYKAIASDVFVNTYKGAHIRGKEQQMNYSKLAALSLLSEESNALSYDARSYFYLLKSNLYFVRRDWKNAFSSTVKLAGLLESNPAKIEEEPRKYIVVLNNILSTCLALNKNEELFFYIEKMKNFAERIDVSRGKAIKEETFLCANYAELEYYWKAGLFEEGIVKIERIREPLLEIIKNPLFTNHEILFKKFFAIFYFGVGQYNKSVYWLNQVINHSATSLRQDVMSAAIIFNLILHYEKGNDDILDYLVRSAYRFLYRKNRLYKFESIILVFIRKKLAKADTDGKLLTAFKSLRRELAALLKDPYENKALEQFDFIAWLDAKIDNKPFSEIVKKTSKVPL